MTVFRQSFGHHNTWTMWIVAAAMLAMILPTLLMPHVWINLRSVEITTDRVGAIVVTADRDIKHDFWGDFSVSIRDENGIFVCQGSPSRPFTYKKQASKASPKNPTANLVIMSLEKWLGGRAALDECVRQGMNNGVFTANTCHMKVLFGLPIARRCVLSNPFGVTPVIGGTK